MIRCQRCQRESVVGARFCSWCGQEIQPQCPTCNTVNPPGSNFCFSCGNRLALDEAATVGGPVEAVAATAPAGLVCPRCSERNEPGSTYCFACGLPLNGQVTTALGDYRQIAAFALGQPGGFWVRVLAYLIDGVLLTVAFAVLWPLISGESITDYWESTELLGTGDVVSFVMDLVYFTGMVAVWSTTVGKRPFGLYVVRTDGSRVGVGRALARYLAYFLSIFTLGLGFVMVAFRRDKRGLHDLVCDTVVIRR